MSCTCQYSIVFFGFSQTCSACQEKKRTEDMLRNMKIRREEERKSKERDNQELMKVPKNYDRFTL